jgi:hypothetical protein
MIDAKTCEVYSVGLCFASVCSDMQPEEITAHVNASHPTGVSSQWQVSPEPFADGTPNPAPCSHDREGCKHYLLVC